MKHKPKYKLASALKGAFNDLGMAAKLMFWGLILYLILKAMPI